MIKFQNKIFIYVGLNFLLLFILTACSASEAHLNSLQSHYPNPSFKKINTEAFSFSLPVDWEVLEKDGGMLEFKENSIQIGGLNIVGYDPKQPASQLQPNHSEVLKEKELSDYFTNVVQFHLELTPAAASTDSHSTHEYHYNIIIDEEKIAYNFYFLTEKISEAAALEIIRTFKLKE